jgi:hypothetical protein
MLAIESGGIGGGGEGSSSSSSGYSVAPHTDDSVKSDSTSDTKKRF